MTTAIFLIVIVAFVGRLVLSASALRNWLAVAIVTILAAGIYAIPIVLGLSLGNVIPGIAICAIMFGIGFGVPTLLVRVERRGRFPKIAALFAGILATALAIDLFRSAAPSHFFTDPGLWLAAGTVCFLVFRSEMFERSSVPAQ